MDILFNGTAGARKYRLLVFRIDGDLYMFRPYVGWGRMVGEYNGEW